MALEVSGVESVPSDLSVTIADAATGKAVDLRKQPRFSISTNEAGDARLRVSVRPGDGDLAEGPIYGVLDAFPHPFSAEVEIRYAVGGWEPVTLTVFDVLGRRVAELISDRLYSPGEFSVVWDGRGPHGPVPGGLYVVRMEAGGRSVGSRALLRVR